ncbi:MAG TPA: calcium-binding protein [Archangium sp.]|uniref:calcium-binding protein n=1 Tax=Archangium sp. TaxID=1872627 RepID=UPI002E2FCD99|nr:calcium-binding protein [Archangium sp.]HEX5753998.1 calcium-binding protein [Archangium sp.]
MQGRRPFAGHGRRAPLAVLLMVAVCIVLLPERASAMALPSINLNAYCQQTHGSSAYEVLVQFNAYGWKCRLNGVDYNMSLDAACRQQHVDGDSASFLDFNNPYSWFCVLRAPYTSFIGNSYSLYAWKGRSVALRTPDTTTCPASTLMNIIDAIDGGYDFYLNATGRAPTPHFLYQGLNSLAAMPSGVYTGCGAGGSACGFFGHTGVEFLQSTFSTICNAAFYSNQYEQTPFYELGRNFWFYGSKIEYVGTDNTGSITTGYAVAMRFLAMDHAGVSASGAPINGYPFHTFRLAVQGLVDAYRFNPGLTWSNTLRAGQAPPNNHGLGGTDFFASFVLRLHRVHGSDFINRLWRRVGAATDAATTQDAVDNFVLAASEAAGVNLHDLFRYTWRWPVSPWVQSYLQGTYGYPVSSQPYL